jgi:hypothetical protein
MLQIKVVEKMKTHVMLGTFFPEIMPFIEVMSKQYGGAIEAADDNMATHCMVDK